MKELSTLGHPPIITVTDAVCLWLVLTLLLGDRMTLLGWDVYIKSLVTLPAPPPHGTLADFSWDVLAVFLLHRPTLFPGDFPWNFAAVRLGHRLASSLSRRRAFLFGNCLTNWLLRLADLSRDLPTTLA